MIETLWISLASNVMYLIIPLYHALEACPSGSYCPMATLNRATGICEP